MWDGFMGCLMFQPGRWDLLRLQRGREGNECQDLHTQGRGDTCSRLGSGQQGRGQSSVGTAHPPANPALFCWGHPAASLPCKWLLVEPQTGLGWEGR